MKILFPGWTRLAAGLFLSSLVLLALRLVPMRIFTLVLCYSFAPLVVSLALLGLAVNGLAVLLAPRRFVPLARRGLARPRRVPARSLHPRPAPPALQRAFGPAAHLVAARAAQRR